MPAPRFPMLLASLFLQAVADTTLLPLLDFAGPEAAAQWQAVNDGVMCGVSDGRFKITKEKTREFFGTPSLDNLTCQAETLAAAVQRLVTPPQFLYQCS